jgi:succinylglutamate desuccinylase
MAWFKNPNFRVTQGIVIREPLRRSRQGLSRLKAGNLGREACPLEAGKAQQFQPVRVSLTG